MTDLVLKVAVPTPLRRLFDYLPPAGDASIHWTCGERVLIPFGRRKLIGIVSGVSSSTDQPRHKLKRVLRRLDDTPVIEPAMFTLLDWASRYYLHPIGDVMHNALPVLLRHEGGRPPRPPQLFALSPEGLAVDATRLKNAPRQMELLRALKKHGPQTETQLNERHAQWRPALKRLVEKGWIEIREQQPWVAETVEAGPKLNVQQRQAVDTVVAAAGRFGCFLLQGVTGSGKTEVYLHCIQHALQAGKQILVLVPEIGLTPQLVARFRRRLPCEVAVLHSGLSDSERLFAWQRARNGQARVVIGTRSALFTPLPDRGLIIIDEEHDASLKQHEGFRYSARDLAVTLARNQEIPILLGSATPSMESLFNVRQGRYTLLPLSERAGSASTPRLHLMDVRHQPLQEGIAPAMRQLIQYHLESDQQVLLFLNRRGFAPTWLCHDCGWLARCERCDAHMIYHQRDRRLRCHHCGAERRAETNCPQCGGEQLVAVGAGTERIEMALRELFPQYQTVRIDRDTTRRKGALDALYKQIKHGRGQILVGTQMLAKGHHLPNVTLVGILNADQGLFSADFRASERLAQLVLQVAGRAGRASQPGEVHIQTHFPEHPLWPALLRQDYAAIADTLLTEREQAHFPPFSSMVLFRAEAVQHEAPLAFLQQVRDILGRAASGGIEIYGPMPAPMERRAGRYRAQLIIQSPERSLLHAMLRHGLPEVEALKDTRQVRWSVDVDPVDTF